MSPDAPDYTLLSDVNVIGSVTLDVNVVGSVTINTNITGASSTVTLNVNVTNEVIQSKLAKPALAFNGENAYVYVPDSSSLQITDYVTVEAYFRFDGYTGIVIDKHEPGIDQYNIYVLDNGKIYFRLVFDSAGAKILPSKYTMTKGEWCHVIGLYDGTYMKLYVNGSLDNTLEIGADTLNPATDIHLEIGAREEGSSGPYRGLISFVRLYHGALSEDDVNRNFDNPQSPVTNGLVMWLNFDEGVGSTAYDKSGNGNHGTIYNAIWVSEQGQVAPLLNVNLTASQITLNINITAQDIDIKIYTPSGRWVTGSDLFAAKVTTGTLAPGCLLYTSPSPRDRG